MFLKRLELQGFKSFAEKTTFDFDHDIVAIVGPNGSGKSNVTDSFRWLLGEREASNLRGGKIEDLIFAGTGTRPRVGQAQAALYFDNSSGFFPIEYKEVSVMRKVSRDETSEFYLNKAEVRLKDIVDFFAKSRLGARGLNVIGQGESDLFVKSTPEERRSMIEEILGLKEYQIEKFEAKRRVRNTLINLDKAKALIEEIRPHLRFLRKQVSRYEGREEMAARLKELEDAFYGSHFVSLVKESKEIEEGLRSIHKQIGAGEVELKKLEVEFEKVKGSEPKANEELKVIKSQRAELLGRRSEVERELGRLEAKLELVSEASDVSGAQLTGALKEIQKIASGLAGVGDIETLKQGINKILNLSENLFKQDKKEISPELKSKTQELSLELKKVEVEIEALAKAESGFESGLETFNQDFQKSFLSMEKEKEELLGLSEKRSHLLLQQERVELRLKDLEYELSEIGRHREEFLGWQGSKEEGGESLKKEMFKLRGALLSIGEVDENLVKEAKETEERYVFLTNQVGDLDKALVDLKTLIKELDFKIHHEFDSAIKKINEEFTEFIRIMFGGGKARLVLEKIEKPKVALGENGEVLPGAEEPNGSGEDEENPEPGIEVELTLPQKKIKSLEVLSGGERSLVSTAALFALISVSPPPFLVLDEIDAALDERNARRFGELLKDFAKKTQFIIVTHNRATMEAADVLYGVTMAEDGTSRVLSVKLQA